MPAAKSRSNKQPHQTAPPLAKLTAPVLRDPLPRERLFAQLDAGSHGAWIVGPPGAGKTTLVAHYLSSRKLKPVWFDMHADDRDPSTFFNMLSEALTTITKQPMPTMGIDSRADWPAFARRFSRSLFLALPQNTAIVFDNVQASAGALDDILAEFKLNNDEHRRLFFISHDPLPGFLIDAVSKQQIKIISAGDLRFDLAETSNMIQKFGHAASEAISVHEQTAGWAAGIVLAGLSPAALGTDDVLNSESREHMIEYLIHHVVNRLDQRTQHILCTCAYFPSFNVALATAASGDTNAGEVLAMLYRNGSFIEKRKSADGCLESYEFHSLFSQALRSKITKDNTPAAMQAAAYLLQQAGQAHAAIPLLLEAKLLDAAQRLIIENAKTILAAGRAEQLARWIGELPDNNIEEEPWLQYWRGMALALVDEFAARSVFESAYATFKRNKNKEGMLLSSIAVMCAIESGWQSYSGAAQWVDDFNRALPAVLCFDNPEFELRVISGTLAAMDLTNYWRDDFPILARRFLTLADCVTDRSLILYVAGQWLNYYQLMREFDSGMQLIHQIDENVSRIEASPLVLALWRWTCSMFMTRAAGALKQPELFKRSAEAHCNAVEIVHRHQLINMKIALAFAECDLFIRNANPASSMPVLTQIKPHLHGNMDRFLGWWHGRQCQTLLLLERPQEAFIESQLSIKHATLADSPGGVIAGCKAMQISCLIWLERYDEAIEKSDEAACQTASGHGKLYLLGKDFILTQQLAKQNSAAANLAIAMFYRNMRDGQLPEYGWFMGKLLAKLCMIALQRGIEVDFVRELITHRQFFPPEFATEEWPWPLKIEALGGFRVSKAEQPLEFDGKSQKKPLEMLQLIVAMSDPLDASKGPKIQQVMDELWPDDEAKDPKGSFDTTLFRLRKLLDVEGAIQLQDGRLQLNRDLVWCDVFAFVEEAKVAHGGTFTHEQKYATRFYHGALFGSGKPFAWSITARERLAALYSDLVTTQGLALEENKQYRDAIKLYEQALDQDNLIEPFHRGQMRSYMALGENAEALRVYRRCKELLSVVLGLKPSAETEVLRLKISQTNESSITK